MDITYVLEAQALAHEIGGIVLRMTIQVPWLVQLNGGEMELETQRKMHEEMFLEYLLEDQDTFLLKKTALREEAVDSTYFVMTYHNHHRANKTGEDQEEGDIWMAHRMLPQAIVEGARMRVLTMERNLEKVLSKTSLLEEKGETSLPFSKMGKMR